MPDFLAAFEAAAKAGRAAGLAFVAALTVPRDILREGDARKAAEAAAAEAFADLEAETEVNEPTDTLPLSVCPCESLEDSCFWCEDASAVGSLEDFIDVLATIPITPAAGAVSIAVENGSDGSSVPHALPSDAPTWVEYVQPAITDVLAAHSFLTDPINRQTYEAAGACTCDPARGCYESDWRDHVAELIAERLEDVTLALPETETAPRYIKPLQ